MPSERAKSYANSHSTLVAPELLAIALLAVFVLGYIQSRANTAGVALEDFFDCERAFADVRRLVAFGPRPSGSQALGRTGEFIMTELRAAGATGVWTPRADANKRPVMVWVHGGGFSEDSARDTWYDGATLAGPGDIVVVTLQYRLGAFGFLKLAGIGGEDYAGSGNLGIWIRSRRSNGCSRTLRHLATIRTMSHCLANRQARRARGS